MCDERWPRSSTKRARASQRQAAAAAARSGEPQAAAASGRSGDSGSKPQAATTASGSERERQQILPKFIKRQRTLGARALGCSRRRASDRAKVRAAWISAIAGGRAARGEQQGGGAWRRARAHRRMRHTQKGAAWPFDRRAQVAATSNRRARRDATRSGDFWRHSSRQKVSGTLVTSKQGARAFHTCRKTDVHVRLNLTHIITMDPTFARARVRFDYREERLHVEIGVRNR